MTVTGWSTWYSRLGQPFSSDIGKIIFKNARSRNKLESKSIDAFIRSKAKIIQVKEV